MAIEIKSEYVSEPQGLRREDFFTGVVLDGVGVLMEPMTAVDEADAGGEAFLLGVIERATFEVTVTARGRIIIAIIAAELVSTLHVVDIEVSTERLFPVELPTVCDSFRPTGLLILRIPLFGLAVLPLDTAKAERRNPSPTDGEDDEAQLEAH